MTAVVDFNELEDTQFLEPTIFIRISKVVDFAALWCFACLSMYYSSTLTSPHHVQLFFVAALTATVTVYVFRTLKLYEIKTLAQFWRCVMGTVSAILPVFFVANIVSEYLGYTQGNWGLYACIVAIPYIVSTRILLCPLVSSLKKSGRLTRRIVIVGGGKYAEEAIQLLLKADDDEFEILGLFDDRTDDRSPESIKKYRKLGRISDLAEFARQHRVDQIIVTIPQSAETRLLTVLKRLWELPVDIKVSAHSSRLRLTPRSYSYMGGLPLLSLFDRPVSGWDALMKAVFDRTAGAVLILAASPVILATALAVRLESKGPVIFRQQRYGFNNELITVYKFRSMYIDMTDHNASKLVTKDDPRVTKVGKFIRKTSLDELPQLFNVLEGKMSLVGPRPHAKSAKAENELYEEVVDGYFARHRIKPGITGLAQIKGYRGETDTREKIEKRVHYDLEYMDRWSVVFDLYIVLMTPVSLIIKNENAY